MEKDKSRGIKHLKDKKKYKPKQIKNTPVETKTKPKSKSLDSNWDRYEENSENEDSIISHSSKNFALLANLPLTQGAHFQFKQDKLTFEEINVENSCSSKLFNLDLNLLNLSLSTVPFFDRIDDLDKSYFTEEQQKHMIQISEQNKKSYDLYLRNLNKDDTTDIKEEIDVPEREIEKTDNRLSDNDNIVNNEDTTENTTKSDNKDVQEEELEQWLDDILDS